MTEIAGGHPFYGQEVGIIILDSRFPRAPGDIGNARSFPFPVRYEVLEGIPPVHLIRQEEPSAVAALIAAAKRLERSGVRVILTSCGLFVRYQERLAASVGVPVATSAVVLLPMLRTLLPAGRKIGVLTADATVLSPVLTKMGWDDPGRVVVAGMEDCPAFRAAISFGPVPPPELNPGRVQDEVNQVVRSLLTRDPDVGAILVECTNLPPYSRGLREAFRLPVLDVIDLAVLLQRAVAV